MPNNSKRHRRRRSALASYRRDLARNLITPDGLRAMGDVMTRVVIIVCILALTGFVLVSQNAAHTAAAFAVLLVLVRSVIRT